MAEPYLGGLHVDTRVDQGGGGQPTEIVEARTRTAGDPDGRLPDAPAPVLVAGGSAVTVGEDEGVRVNGGETDLLAAPLSAHEPAAFHDHGSATFAAHRRRGVVTFGQGASARHCPWSSALVAGRWSPLAEDRRDRSAGRVQRQPGGPLEALVRDLWPVRAAHARQAMADPHGWT